MPANKKRADFYTSEEGVMVAKALQLMVMDTAYVTEPTFSANTEKYADNLIPFVDKHMAYLRDHPITDTQHYLSNLRIMTRVRR